MNIAIVEDMDSDFLLLKNILLKNELYKKLDITISRYKNGESFLSHFHADKYQLLFLDMILDGPMTGMDIARNVRELSTTLPIVFTTTERDYALEGYEVQALDYLVKPYSAQRVDSILQRILSAGAVKAYLTVQIERESVRFPLDELMWAASSNHTMEIHLKGKKTLRCYMKFEEFCSLLPKNKEFLCCSRGIIVHMKYVDYIEKSDFILTDGKMIPISRAKRTDMQMAFNEYQIRATRGKLL